MDDKPIDSATYTAQWIAQRKRERRRLLPGELVIGGFTAIVLALIIIVLAMAR